MKKRIIVLLICAVALVLNLTACDSTEIFENIFEFYEDVFDRLPLGEKIDNDRLNEVMPGGIVYKDITASLENVPSSVVKVYHETTGLGYVVEAEAYSQFTTSTPMEILIGVSVDGKICGIALLRHSESLIFDENYPSTYIGADSTLYGVELYAGSTYSSKAFRGAVQDAMNVLVENDLIKAAEKSDAQILEELIATVAPELAEAKKSEGKGDIVTEYKANGGAAYIVKDGETLYLAVVSEDGACKLYNVEGADVTADKADIVKKVTDYAASAANDRLNAVMPGGSAYEDITATLSNLPESVVKVSRETTGLGFVIETQATSDYTGSTPMDIVIGVDMSGKICGIKLVSHSESLIFGAEYPDTYIGQDSALADVDIYAGSTFSSTAFKNAVSEAMEALAANNLVSAGVKSDAQILTEMIPTLHTGLTSAGMFKATEVAASGNIEIGYKALNGSGYAFIIKSGEASFLALVNASGVCKVYDTTGADVTDANAAVSAEAIAAAELKNFETEANKMITKKFDDATEITPIELTTFSNVVYACSFKSGENTYYAFYSTPLSYGDEAMAICTVIDENGAIVNQNIKQMAFGHGVEYMPGIQDYVNSSSQAYKDYLAKFEGMTGETLGDDVLISGGTISSSAVKLATKDAFNAFESIKGGEQ